MVPTDADDLASHAGSDLVKLTLLVGRSLLGGRDAKVESGAFHRKVSPVLLPERVPHQNGAFCWLFGNTISRGFFVQFLHGTEVCFREQSGHRNGVASMSMRRE